MFRFASPTLSLTRRPTLSHSYGVRLCLAVLRALLPVTYVFSVGLNPPSRLGHTEYYLVCYILATHAPFGSPSLMAGRSSLSSGPFLRAPFGQPLGRGPPHRPLYGRIGRCTSLPCRAPWSCLRYRPTRAQPALPARLSPVPSLNRSRGAGQLASYGGAFGTEDDRAL